MKRPKPKICPMVEKDADKKRYIFNKITQELKISSDQPVKLMLAQRMTSVWFRMAEVEKQIASYGMSFEERTDKGELIGVKVNELNYLLKQLDAEFRSFYRILNQKWANNTEKENDFLSALANAKEVEVKEEKEDESGTNEG